MTSLDRWKHCVVHIEFRPSEEDIEKARSGTAVFVKYKGKYFLVTAFHLVKDTETSSGKPIFNGTLFRVPLLTELEDEYKKELITKNVFFEKGTLKYQKTPEGIPYLREGEDVPIPKFILLSESTDPTDSAITYSEEKDLAVISLRGRIHEGFGKLFYNDLLFVEELLHLGYQPLSEEEIGLEPSEEGADILTVGFPDHISHTGERADFAYRYGRYLSGDIVLPCFTFGRVSMTSPSLHFFWGDIRVYGGSSGSPIIEDGNLVGVVTHEAVMEMDGDFNKIPFAKATKVKYLPEMFEEQIRKDNVFLDPESIRRRQAEAVKRFEMSEESAISSTDE